jgi:hypothetical protein
MGYKRSEKITTRGMSNVSYGYIRDWPEELITHCYQLLTIMWSREHIPQACKEKWAVLLAKTTDMADINNLQSIRLEDCMHKMWPSNSYIGIFLTWKNMVHLTKLITALYLAAAQTVGFSIYSISLKKRRNRVLALLCFWVVKRVSDSVSQTVIRMAPS